VTLSEENPNDATMLVVTNGLTPQDVGAYARILDVFDGHDGQALHAARERWKAYKQTDHELQYIQQQKDGSWKKQA
jgi:DNA polymerase-3 subunit chi